MSFSQKFAPAKISCYTVIQYCSFRRLQPELNIVASFDRRGERIVTGSSKGKVSVIVRIKLLKFFGFRDVKFVTKEQ